MHGAVLSSCTAKYVSISVPMQGKNHTIATTRGVSASVVRDETSWQSGSGRATSVTFIALM